MKTEELEILVQRGENEVLELKATIPPPDIVARHLASMANTSGGLLVLGVKEPAEYVGVDVRRAESVLASAGRLLTPSHQIAVETLEVQGKSIVVASVKRSENLIASFGGFYRRVGDQTRALTAEEIKVHALSERSPDTALSELSAAIAAQTSTIDGLRTDFEKANSPWKKIGIAVAGAAAGALIKHLLDTWLG